MAVGNVVIENEGIKKFFTHFFGDVVSTAYISKLVDIKDFHENDEILMRNHNLQIANDFKSISDFMQLDGIGYNIILTFSSGKSVDIDLAEPCYPMSFTKFDIRDALILR